MTISATGEGSTANAPGKAALWGGRILGVGVVGMLAMSASMKFSMPKEAVEGFAHLGWPTGVAGALGVVELGCAVLYVIPRTAVLGAVLMTGYLGGATATHVRVEEAFLIPVILGVVAWAGLWLREPRLRSLLPLR